MTSKKELFLFYAVTFSLLAVFIYTETGSGGGGVLLEFKKIFMDYYDKILRQLIYMLDDWFIAEDVAQEVFIKLYQHPPSGEEHLGAWLYQVAKNMALNRIRSDKSRMARENKAFALEGLPAFTPFELKEELMYAREVLSRMEERDRAVLIMKHSGYSYDEIARTVGVKRTSVGTLIARAQKKFKQMYEEV